jgi:hypothetical protein
VKSKTVQLVVLASDLDFDNLDTIWNVDLLGGMPAYLIYESIWHAHTDDE